MPARPGAPACSYPPPVPFLHPLSPPPPLPSCSCPCQVSALAKKFLPDLTPLAPSLRALSLAGNRMTRLPDFIVRLVALEVLDVSGERPRNRHPNLSFPCSPAPLLALPCPCPALPLLPCPCPTVPPAWWRSRWLTCPVSTPTHTHRVALPLPALPPSHNFHKGFGNEGFRPNPNHTLYRLLPGALREVGAGAPASRRLLERFKLLGPPSSPLPPLPLSCPPPGALLRPPPTANPNPPPPTAAAQATASCRTADPADGGARGAALAGALRFQGFETMYPEP